MSHAVSSSETTPTQEQTQLTPTNTGAPDDLVLRLEHAKQIARESAAVTLAHFQSCVNVRTKKDGSPVTVADTECETFLRKRISEIFPKDGMLGEEHAETFGTSGYRWIIDPIDGTRSFVQGVPLWGTLIGIEKAFFDGTSSVVAGVIYMPALDEMVWASDGHGAWHSAPSPEALIARTQANQLDSESRTVRAQVSSTTKLKDAVVCTTSVRGMHNAGWDGVHVELGIKSRAVRGWSDCYAHLLLCTGRVDAIVEPVIAPWDIAAMIPILREAGGKYTHPAGHTPDDAHQSQGIGTNAKIHDELVEFVQEYRIHE